jgi:hypothetical protein
MIVDHLKTVQSNVANNRKNIAAQIESLKVQLASSEATLNEMDSLAATLEVALKDQQLILDAEAARPAIVEAGAAVAAAIAKGE